MRILLVAAIALAGCSGSVSILSLGDCERIKADEGGQSAIQECTNVAGAGTFSWETDCQQGLLGVEREAGNGTVQATFIRADGSRETHNLTGEDDGEAFADFHEPGARMHLRTSADFAAAELTFGVLCFDEPFA